MLAGLKNVALTIKYHEPSLLFYGCVSSFYFLMIHFSDFADIKAAVVVLFVIGRTSQCTSI